MVPVIRWVRGQPMLMPVMVGAYLMPILPSSESNP